MGCLESDVSDLWLYRLPTEAEHRTLAAKKPGKLYKRVAEATEKDTRRSFFLKKGTVARPRELEVQTA